MALELENAEKHLRGTDDKRHNFNNVMTQFLDEYVPARFGHLRPTTSKSYESISKNLVPFFLNKYLDEINTGLIMEFISKRALDGVANKTIGNDLGVLSSMFTFAMENEYINHNPVANLKRGTKKRLKTFKEQRRFLTHEEESAICRAFHLMQDPKNSAQLVGKESELNYTRESMVIFDIETGLRRTELFQLKIGNLELERKNHVTGNPEPQLRVVGKGGKERIVPLSRRALDALPSKIWSKSNQPETIVFPNPITGKPFTSLLHGLKLGAKRAGIKDWNKLKIHDLRRTFACRYLKEHPKDYWSLMMLMGHSSLDVTRKSYAWLETADIHKNFNHEKQDA
jgi:integrase/recombinase XerC